ncbi:putative repeat protein (TIGR01451 family) [Actinocorallia herbida]|uniref:Putative repeat protein (TIGR01451 family) n=1 Tax=Actinocorallia herbida TaxID=58109 RepID=A0A3N1CTF5_9ACTN|nr:DUF11 domain-containing protein [Actinocorallia herbida]ROO84592.1 putative repeat protein (TIGR01451 family) [Actinocorallia herbida]
MEQRPGRSVRRGGRAVATVMAVVLALTGQAFVRPAAADVPDPTPTTSVVTVKTGGDRTGDNAVGPLAGVVLGLFLDEAGTDPVTEDWGRCTSDADGDCSFIVPDTGEGGANRDNVYYVKQISAPAGWYTNPTLRTGRGSGSGSVETAYIFPTPALQGGETYRSTSDFMFDLTKAEPLASSGIWQQSRDNPGLPDRCGLNAALVLDLSASVGSALPQLKAAADTFADALVGTPSRLALFTFDRRSPSTGTENFPELRSVSTQAGADEFKALYQDYALGSGTNWDQGLWRVAEAQEDPANDYDLVVVLTDGNPTYFDDLTGDGSNTRVAEVEGGIFSANAVKSHGSRVIALGVGNGVTGITGLNLRAISGPVAFDTENPNPLTADYYQTTDFAAAGRALRDLVTGQCAGSLSVVKKIVPPENPDGDLSGAEAAGPGWQFNASTSTAGSSVDPSSATTVDDGTGTVTFDIDDGGDPTTSVAVEEVVQDDFTFLFAATTCTRLSDGAAVDVDTAETGFTVDVAQGAAISCIVYNKPQGTVDVTVTKVWNIDGTIVPADRLPDGFEANATLTGPGDLPASDQEFGDPREGYSLNDQVTVNEEVTVPDDCTVVGTITRIDGDESEHPLPHTDTLIQEHSTFEITNTVDCPDTGDVVVDKQWVIDENFYPEGDQPEGFTAQLGLTGPGGAGATPQDWNVPRPGYAVGSNVTISETVGRFTDPSCVLVSSRLTEEGGEQVNRPVPHTAQVTGFDDAFVITNTVDCAAGPNLGIEKKSDATTARPGDTITYTITLTNTGTEDFAEDQLASFQDDLTDVLRNASYNNDATVSPRTGTLGFAEPILSWTGPLEVGASVTVTYSVTVDDDAPDGALLCNTVTAEPDADCTDTNCVRIRDRVKPPKPCKHCGHHGKPKHGKPWHHGRPWHHGGPGHHGRPWHHDRPRHHHGRPGQNRPWQQDQWQNRPWQNDRWQEGGDRSA